MPEEKRGKLPPFNEGEVRNRIETHLRILRMQGKDALRRYLIEEEQRMRLPLQDETDKKAS